MAEPEPTAAPTPTRSAPAVIRRVTYAEEPLSDRLLKRIAPAWLISSVLHLVIIGVGMSLKSTEVSATTKIDKVVTTEVEEQKEEMENFEETIEGLDPNLEPATESMLEAKDLVEAPDNMAEPPGIQDTAAMADISSAPVGLEAAIADPGIDGVEGMLKNGGSAGGGNNTGMLKGRSGATRNALVQAGGGNTASEAAVARGLIYLQKAQDKDGGWTYDGEPGLAKTNRHAATGMALLPFLAAGQTHRGAMDDKLNRVVPNKYTKTVADGIEFLKRSMGNGSMFVSKPDGHYTYSHAIATVALCEAFGMSGDPSLKAYAQRAVTLIANGQLPDGGWGYTYAAAARTPRSSAGRFRR